MWNCLTRLTSDDCCHTIRILRSCNLQVEHKEIWDSDKNMVTIFGFMSVRSWTYHKDICFRCLQTLHEMLQSTTRDWTTIRRRKLIDGLTTPGDLGSFYEAFVISHKKKKRNTLKCQAQDVRKKIFLFWTLLDSYF